MIPYEVKEGKLEELINKQGGDDLLFKMFTRIGLKQDAKVRLYSGSVWVSYSDEEIEEMEEELSRLDEGKECEELKERIARAKEDAESAKIGPGKREVKGDMWELYLDEGDFALAVYDKGEPKLGWYLSSRGSLYQAGVYVKDEDKHFWANNLQKNKENNDKWHEGKGIDSEIAHDFLLGEKEQVRCGY